MVCRAPLSDSRTSSFPASFCADGAFPSGGLHWLDREQSYCSPHSLPPWAWELLQRAELMADAGRLVEAANLLDQSLLCSDGPAASPQDALALARLRLQLGAWCQQVGAPAKAEQHLLSAFEILDFRLGGDCPESAAVLNQLALLYDSAVMPQQVVEMRRGLLELRRRCLGDADPAVAMAWAALATAMVNAGEILDSVKCWQEALNTLEQSLPEWLPTYERLGLSYGAVLQDCGLTHQSTIFQKRLQRLRQLYS